MSRIIHMANAFCEKGTKVTILCGRQRNDNSERLKSLLHENASVYVARSNGDLQILNQRLAGKLADEQGIPEVAIHDLRRFFHAAGRKDFERKSSSLSSKLSKKMPARLQLVTELIFDEEAGAGRRYLSEILPAPIYEKYRGLVQFYAYNYFFIIQTLIIHKTIEPIDAIQCHDLWSLPIGGITKEWFGIPVLYDAHEICTWIFENQIDRSLAIANEKWLYEMCDTFTTTTEGMAAYYRSLCPFLNPLVITNAHRELWAKPKNLDTLKERLSLPPHTPLAVFVGNLQQLSHLDRIITALPSCKTDFHLAIVGDRGNIEKYQELAKNLNLEKRVFFLGRMDYEKVFSTIYGADFGIIPNLQNYFNPPNTVLSSKFFDYAQVELPIISDHCSEVQRVIDEFQIGQTVDFQLSSVEVAQMLDDFYARILAGDFPAEERKRARESFVWPENVVDQILSANPDRAIAQSSRS